MSRLLRNLNSPTYNSISKQHWSFSKSQRFFKPKIYCDKYYDLPSTKSNRKTSFGIGNKTDILYESRYNTTPSPDTYQINNFVEINQIAKKGFTAKYGRDDTQPVSYIPLQAKKNPGPGQYDPQIPQKNPKWTMRPKSPSKIRAKSQSPGPGAYQSIENINPTGKYHTSKHRTSQSRTFNPISSKRFSKVQSNTPGSGNYHPKNDLSNQGVYVLSTNKSAGKRIILLAERQTYFDHQAKKSQGIPGPGKYVAPSNFPQFQQDLNMDMLQKKKKNTKRPLTSIRK